VIIGMIVTIGIIVTIVTIGIIRDHSPARRVRAILPQEAAP
jgi:hypothetical protein